MARRTHTFTLIELLVAKHAVAKSPATCGARAEARVTRAAFTLIELLVVIAIIAILAALLLPVLGRAKKAARNTLCINNLHELTVASLMYAADYDEEFSMPGGWDTGYHTGRLGPHDCNYFAFNDLAPYIDRNWHIGATSPIPVTYGCPFIQYRPAGGRTGYAYYGNLESPLVQTKPGNDYSGSAPTVYQPNDGAYGFGDVAPDFKTKYARRSCSGEAVVWADCVFWGAWDRPNAEGYAHTFGGSVQEALNHPETGFADFELINVATVDGAVEAHRHDVFQPSSAGLGWSFRYWWGPMYFWF